jgi:hypothetical protein
MYNPVVHVESVDGSVITLLVDGKERVFDLEDMLIVDQSDLSTAMAKQSATYGYVGMLQASSEKYNVTCKRNMEVGYAAADERVRADYKERGVKYTEAVVKAGVEQSRAYQALVDDYDDSTFAVKIIKMLISALEMKANMLISLGALIRSEIGMTGMYIKEEAYTKNVEENINTLKKSITKKQTADV